MPWRPRKGRQGPAYSNEGAAGRPLAYHPFHGFAQNVGRIQRAQVVASRELAHISVQMLRRYLMECPVAGSLQNRPELSMPFVCACRRTYSRAPWLTPSCARLMTLQAPVSSVQTVAIRNPPGGSNADWASAGVHPARLGSLPWPCAAIQSIVLDEHLAGQPLADHSVGDELHLRERVACADAMPACEVGDAALKRCLTLNLW